MYLVTSQHCCDDRGCALISNNCTVLTVNEKEGLLSVVCYVLWFCYFIDCCLLHQTVARTVETVKIS